MFDDESRSMVNTSLLGVVMPCMLNFSLSNSRMLGDKNAGNVGPKRNGMPKYSNVNIRMMDFCSYHAKWKEIGTSRK